MFFSMQSISPGNVRTEIYPPEQMEVVKDAPYLEPKDVSNAVLYAIGTPPHVQVNSFFSIYI